MNRNDLFSVVILCYRNFEFLYEALDSVLQQSYAEIELIVSDDGSPQFPKDEICAYIERKKKGNLINYLVNHAEVNQGTVKHVNQALLLCQGTYISFFASDDMLQDDTVLQQYVNSFEECDEACNIVMAQTAMYDRAMQKCEAYFLAPEVQNIIAQPVQYDLLFQRLAQGACLTSGSTCYRKAFFEESGYFDESFSLIEDYPLHLRFAIEKIPFFYKNFIALKHRDGGISHGAVSALSASKKQYYMDERNSYEIVLSQIDIIISTAERTAIKSRLKSKCIWLDDLLYMKGNGMAGALIFAHKHPFAFFKKSIDKINSVLGDFGKNLLIVMLLALNTVPMCAQSFEEIFSCFPKEKIQLFMFILFCCFGSVGFIMYIFRIIYRVIHAFEIFPSPKTNLLS